MTTPPRHLTRSNLGKLVHRQSPPILPIASCEACHPLLLIKKQGTQVHPGSSPLDLLCLSRVRIGPSLPLTVRLSFPQPGEEAQL